ncbi:MAG: glycosyltransferase family 4 protein [Gammaproteobacteria bacterium]|nr:glycosyltransferase family 4 protein [Gammaproteobacteria bacterium]
MTEGDRVVFLVEEQSNPSTDYFLLPAISARSLNVVRCTFTDLPSAEQLDDALVVFVRYVPPAWARLIATLRPRLRGLVFFMDDDVLDVRASVGMPLRYRFKLARLAARYQKWLRRHDAELWVATLYLQQKYAHWHPRLVLPFPIQNSNDVCRVFYHGSASHGAEIRWLHPVMAEVLRRDERIHFEIIGGEEVYRLFRGLPRVTVVHPMKWPAYQAFLAMPGRHIGLVPLHDLPFNRARSYTKFLDITRCGAAGIYSPGSTSAEMVSHQCEGLVIPLEQKCWIEAIVRLAGDESLRRTLAANAGKKLPELAERAQNSCPVLLNTTKKI